MNDKKILLTSDLHGSLPKVEPCDILVIAGDVCPIAGGHDLYTQRHWVKDHFEPWLKSVPAKHIVGIAGNHDFIFEASGDVAYNLPWEYLIDESIELEGIMFYGTPWVPNLHNWAFYKSDIDLERIWGELPEGIDVLVSHGPPHRHGDRVKMGRCVGNRSMLKAIEDKKPAAVVCGHIHEGYGLYTVGKTDIYNVSYMDERYEPVNAVVELA